MSENLCEGGAPAFLPNRARSGLNPALSIPAFSAPQPFPPNAGPFLAGLERQTTLSQMSWL